MANRLLRRVGCLLRRSPQSQDQGWIPRRRPAFAFLENVPGLLAKPYFGTILGELAEAGYRVEWDCVSVAEVGAPHKRERLWIIAHDSSWQSWPIFIQSRKGSTNITRSGNKTLAYPNSLGCNRRSINEGQETPERGRTSTGGKNMADARSNGLALNGKSGDGPEKRDTGRVPPDDGGEFWAIEPELGRVADGVAHRVDRLRAIGNGQVPGVAAMAWRLLTARITTQPADR